MFFGLSQKEVLTQQRLKLIAERSHSCHPVRQKEVLTQQRLKHASPASTATWVFMSERSSNTTKIETPYTSRILSFLKSQKEVLTQQRLKPHSLIVSYSLSASERSSNTTKIETIYNLYKTQYDRRQKEVLTQQRLKPDDSAMIIRLVKVRKKF